MARIRPCLSRRKYYFTIDNKISTLVFTQGSMLLLIVGSYIKGALCSFTDNTNEAIIQTQIIFFCLFSISEWTSSSQRRNKVPRRLFEAGTVAGSAKYKQSQTVWALSFKFTLFIQSCKCREFVCLVCLGINKVFSPDSVFLSPKTTQCTFRSLLGRLLRREPVWACVVLLDTTAAARLNDVI